MLKKLFKKSKTSEAIKNDVLLEREYVIDMFKNFQGRLVYTRDKTAFDANRQTDAAYFNGDDISVGWYMPVVYEFNRNFLSINLYDLIKTNLGCSVEETSQKLIEIMRTNLKIKGVDKYSSVNLYYPEFSIVESLGLEINFQDMRNIVFLALKWFAEERPLKKEHSKCLISIVYDHHMPIQIKTPEPDCFLEYIIVLNAENLKSFHCKKSVVQYHENKFMIQIRNHYTAKNEDYEIMTDILVGLVYAGLISCEYSSKTSMRHWKCSICNKNNTSINESYFVSPQDGENLKIFKYAPLLDKCFKALEEFKNK